jgi:phospholipid/cholesterol/gamma-HCH transport system substrate-binding protein
MKDKNLEIKVGAFFLFGLLAAGVLVVMFGRFGQFSRSNYEITVQFANSSGVLKNSQVLYRGAKVGSVAEAPMIADGGQSVELLLKIRNDIKIDKESKFKVGVYGLLGDRFIDVIPPLENSGNTIQAGEVVKGSESKGFGDIAERLDSISENVQKKLLTDELAGDVHDAVKNAKNLLARMDRFMSEAEAGKGSLYMLMKDEKVANDLRITVGEMKQLSINLRSRGVLFYKDLSEDNAKKAVEKPKSSTGKASAGR